MEGRDSKHGASEEGTLVHPTSLLVGDQQHVAVAGGHALFVFALDGA